MASTDASGSFALPVAPGSYTLTVAYAGFQPATTAVLTAIDGQTTDAGTIALGAIQTFTFDVLPGAASGSGTATAMIVLAASAPAGGKPFTLSSDSASLSVPASVTVAANTRVLTFPVTYAAVATPTWVTVSATSSGVTNQAHITLTPGPAVVSVSVNKETVVGPANLIGTLSVSGPAPTGGLLVNLTSSRAPTVTVPATVLVPAGALAVSFPVSVAAAATTAVSTITASTSSGGASTPLTVTPAPALASMDLVPYGKTGSQVSIAVNLNARAPTGGAVVSLSSSNPTTVPVPASVTVTSLNWSASALSVLGAASATPVIVTATYQGMSRSSAITVSSLLASQQMTANQGLNMVYGTLTLTGTTTGASWASFYSSNPSIVSVPANVSVPSGSTQANVSSTVASIAAPATVVQAGSYGGRELLSAPLVVLPYPAPSNFSLGTAIGGTAFSGYVYLTGNAPAGGMTVALGSSDPATLTVPASVFVPAGTSSAMFSGSTTAVASSTVVSLTATASGVTATGTTTVLKPWLTGISLSPTSVTGGTPATGTVTLSGIAPVTGYAVSLTSSNGSLASVPATITVPAGSNTATFPIPTAAVSTDTSATITANDGGTPWNATLTVLAPRVASLTFSPPSVQAGDPCMGTVTLDGIAPQGGASVSLYSQKTSVATVPASAMIAAGATSATFPVTTYPVVSTTNVPISASYGSSGLWGTLVVTPLPSTLTSVSVTPAVISGGLNATGTVTMATAAPAGSLTVALTSSDPTVASVPASVTVPANSTSASFTIPTVGVGLSVAITISGTYGGVIKSGTFTVDPAILASVTLSPFSLVAGSPSTGTVSLSGKAPATGLVITLASSDTNVANVPPNVTIPPTASMATFPIATNGALTTGSATISATGGYRNETRTALLTLTPTPIGLAGFTLSAPSVASGVSVTATVTLNQPAPAGGANISLSSSDTSVAQPPSGVLVAAGASTASASFYARGVSGPTLVTLSATFNGVTLSAPLTVTPATLVQVTLTPSAVAGGNSVAGTASLNGPAPTGGAVVTLSSSLPAVAAVPASVTIASGYTSASFTVTTAPVSTSTPVTITATYMSVQVTAPLSVDPLGLASVTLWSGIKAGQFFSGTVTLNSPAPTGGYSVDMTASGAASFVVTGQAGTETVSALTLTIAAGQTSKYVSMLAEWSPTAGIATVTATLNGVTKTGSTTIAAGTASFWISPTLIARGGTTMGAILFDGYPPITSEVPVTLASSNSGIVLAAASVNACPTIPCGTITTIHAGTVWHLPIGVTTTSSPGDTTVSATFLGLTKTATLTVAATPPVTLAGVAPGWVVPGDTTPALWGSNFEPGSTVTFSGPVYTLADILHPLCSVGLDCPVQNLTGTVNADFTSLGFAVPAGLQPGIYHLVAKDPAGVNSTNNKWIAVDQAQKTYAALTPEQHKLATRIYPGQTVTGTFTGDNPLNAIADYNYYYFSATAGTHLSVSMQRADSSVPWESPASLDPQIEVIAPDGFIYSNLQAFDNVPGVDYNAALSDVILPQAGIYILAAETTRGRGDYRLTFSLSSVASAPAGERVFALAGGGSTVPLNTTLKPTAVMFDPRGWPVSGADVTFAVANGPDDTGTALFLPSAATSTTLDGLAQVSAKVTAAGKVQFSPAFGNSVLASAVAGSGDSGHAAFATAGAATASPAAATVPRYRPVGRQNIRITGVYENVLGLAVGRLERFQQPEEGGRILLAPDGRVLSRSDSGLPASPPKAITAAAPSSAFSAKKASAPVSAPANAIAGCSSATFSELAVSGPVAPGPYSVSLSDLTPSTGQSLPNGAVNLSDGIHGHRIEKTIRLRIDVKDANGNTPNHPVLVSMGVDGASHGTLILDPDGNRVQCDQASFVWHPSGASGSGLNEEFEYTLGTFSLYEGFTGSDPGPYQPAWGEAETLDIRVTTLAADGSQDLGETDFPVRPEPGKPDHFLCLNYDFTPCPDSLSYWTGYLVYPAGLKNDGTQKTASGPFAVYDSYFLKDKYDNVCWGYGSATSTQAASNVQTTFSSQQNDPLTSVPFDRAQYRLQTSWNDDPQMPNGHYPLTLSVGCDDPEWGACQVAKAIAYDFLSTPSRAIIRQRSYEKRFGADDGTSPYRVVPGATTAAMPKTSLGDVQRMTLITVSGSKVLATLPEVFEDPHTIWRASSGTWVVDHFESPQDPRLVTAETPRFRLRLVDENGNLVTDGAFRVHRCPRFDHEGAPVQSGVGGVAGRPCTLPPVESVNGVIDAIEFNSPYPAASGDSTDSHRAYFGIEPLRAPYELGLYFIDVQAIGNTYLVRRQSDFATDASPAGESRGAFLFLNVDNRADPDCRCGDAGCGFTNCTGSPVVVGSGVYTTSATDLTLPTAGFPLSIGRLYLSSSTTKGLHGPGWRSSLEAKLAYRLTQTGRVVVVTLPSGQQLAFSYKSAEGPFTPPLGRKDTLVRNPDGTFDLTLEKSRNIYRFDDKGRLTRMTDEFGSAIAVTYNASSQVQRLADQAGSGRFVDVFYLGDRKIDYVRDSAGREVHYGYDGQGNLSTVTDPAGRATRYSYNTGSFGPVLTQIADNWNRPLTIITWDLADRVTSYSEHGETYTYNYIDATHTSKTDTVGNTTSFDFGDGGLIGGRAQSGSSTTTQYNPDGSIQTAFDEVGVATSYTYGAQGHVLTVTRNGAGASIEHDYAYDPVFPEKVVSVTPKNPSSHAVDPNWQGWKYDYWPTGNAAPGALKTVQRVKDDGTTLETVSSFEYDGKGRITKQTTATGASTDYVYDGAGNLSTVTAPLNADSGARSETTYSSYDGVGRPQTILDPNAKSTSYTYDPLGRVLTVTLPPVSGKVFTTTYSYDHFDAGTQLVFTHITDPNGNLTKLGYDAEGRLRKSIDAATNETTYAYTNDVLTSITDPNGNVTSYQYDALKRLWKTAFPEGNEETYAYYADGLLQSKTDRKGQTITYQYDGFKRLTKKIYPDSTAITYTYTGQKLVTVIDGTKTPSETHTFGYDGSYRVASNTQGLRGTLAYTYTPDDRVQTMAVASGPTQTYAYYPDGSLNTTTWSVVAGNFKYTYTPTGQYQEISFPNGQKRDYSYDDQGRLVTLSNTLGATNLASFSYGYDHDWTLGSDTMLGQRTSMTATVPAQGLSAAQSKYYYDPLYQLLKAQYPTGTVFNGETHEWTYDALGNRISSKVNGTGPAYTYLKNGPNPLNGQRLTSDGVNAYTYDPNGSQTARTGSANYGFGYDTDNRLASITGAETAAYAYDYQGRRISKTEAGVTTTYLYDGLNPIAETVGAAPTYVLNGPSIDEPLAVSASGTISYLNADGLGSVISTNDSAGTALHSLSFDAWGVPKNETGTRAHGFTYTGREVGVAGQHFYRARFLQPGVGRFNREDPKRFESGPNFFVYAGGSPLSMVDPLGTRFGDWWDVRATIEYYDEVATTTANPWAAASASVASALLKVSGVREAQEAGEFAGYGNDTCAAQRAMMALLKGLTFAGPLLGSRATIQTASRFFVDPRASSTARAAYWSVRGGATHVGTRFQLHHWFEAERFGGSNAGWNLFAIPRLLNAYMNGAPSTLWAETLLRGTVLAAPGVGVAAGAFAGLFDPACACKPGD